MAIMDPRKALEAVEITEFGGISASLKPNADGASDLRNFRVRADGTLEKRGGFRTWLSLGGAIRATWEGTVDGKTYFFAVAGDAVYCLPPDETEATAIFFLATSEGAVSFFFYRDVLYLTDGASLLRFRSNLGTFTVAEGYTPLYGQNWHPTEMGSVFEELNLLQNRIRIHYLNVTGSTVFRLPYTPKSIDRLRVNGSLVTNYTLNVANGSFEIPSELATGGTVEVAVTLADVFDRRSTVVTASRVAVYRDPHHETVLSYGTSAGYHVYRSAAVTDDMLEASNASYSGGDALYIPQNKMFAVGSVQHPVTALLQSDEQMLVMNDRDLWAIRHLDDDSDDMRIYLLRTGVGCLSQGGALLCGKDPVTVCGDGLNRLTFGTADPDVFSTQSMSEDISDRMGSELFKRAILFFDKRTSELWVRDPEDASGTVWVCDTVRDRWVCFDKLRAVCFFERQGAVGFGTSDGRLCLMDDALDTDDGEEIEAYYLSQYLSFSHPSFFKRALRVSLCADTFGGRLGLGLESERDSHLFSMNGKGGDAPELFDRRLAFGRFRFLRFRITVGGAARSRIRFLSLAANN